MWGGGDASVDEPPDQPQQPSRHSNGAAPRSVAGHGRRLVAASGCPHRRRPQAPDHDIAAPAGTTPVGGGRDHEHHRNNDDEHPWASGQTPARPDRRPARHHRPPAAGAAGRPPLRHHDSARPDREHHRPLGHPALSPAADHPTPGPPPPPGAGRAPPAPYRRGQGRLHRLRLVPARTRMAPGRPTGHHPAPPQRALAYLPGSHPGRHRGAPGHREGCPRRRRSTWPPRTPPASWPSATTTRPTWTPAPNRPRTATTPRSSGCSTTHKEQPVSTPRFAPTSA